MGGVDPLGVFLRECREELGFSLHEVCRRAGRLGVQLSPSHLRRIERGKMPRGDHLAALCRVYGLPPWLLLDLALVSGDNALRLPGAEGASPADLLREGDRLVAEGRMARARGRFAVARVKAREAGDRVAELAATARLAWLDLYEGHFAAALVGFSRVLEAEDAPPRERDIARVRLLRLHVRLGWKEQALALVDGVRAIAEDRRRDVVMRAGAWDVLAVFEERYGDSERAVACWKAAIRLLSRAGRQRERVRAGIGYADLLLALGRYGEAARVARDLERRTRTAEARGLRPAVLDRLGRALVLAGRPRRALPWLVELRELAEDREDPDRLVRAIAWEARARWLAGEEKSARVLLRRLKGGPAATLENDPETARVIAELERAMAPGADEPRAAGKADGVGQAGRRLPEGTLPGGAA